MKLPDLGQMMGPLPLGGWVAVVGGGLGLAAVAKNRGGAKEEPELVEEVTPVYPATPRTAGPANLSPALPDNVTGAPPITDNGEWISMAVRALTLRGYAPYTSQQCLARYLEGVIEGAPCVAIVDQAILLVGAPPTGAPVNQFPIPPPVVNRPPAPTTPPAVAPAPDRYRYTEVVGKTGTSEGIRARNALGPGAVIYRTRANHPRPGVTTYYVRIPNR